MNDIVNWLRTREKYRRKTNKLKQKLESEGIVCLIHRGKPILETKTNNTDDICLCITCCESQRNCAMFPCGHLVFCQNCFFRYWSENDICPICRKIILEYHKVYI